MDTCIPQRFRVRYHHRAWRGKPDPSGMGVSYWLADNLGDASAKAHEFQRKGCWGITMQKRDDTGSWVTL